MARTIIDFPASLVRWRQFALTVNPQTRAGSQSTTGNGQVSFGNQPRWRLDATLLLRTKTDVLAWRSFVSRMRGRLNAIRIPVTDPLRPSLDEIGISPGSIAEIEGDGIPFSDDTLFDDVVGFDYRPAGQVLIAAPKGATEITVDARAFGDCLRIGNFFSIDDWVYQITGYSGTPDKRTYGFEMPLRRAVSVGDVMEVWASGIFVFSDDMAGMAPLSHDTLTVVEVSLSMEEWISRP